MIRTQVALLGVLRPFFETQVSGGRVACACSATRGRYGAGRLTLLLAWLTLWLATPALAVPPGTDIVNIATGSFMRSGSGVMVTSNTVTTTTVGTRTPAIVEILRHDLAAGLPVNVDPGQLCSTSGTSAGPFTPMPNPTGLSGAAIDLNAPVDLSPATVFLGSEAVFVRLTDLDQNLDPATRETVVVRYGSTSTGDSEAATLYETGLDTGVFAGSIMLTDPGSSAGDCALAVGDDARFTVDYTDAFDSTDTSMDDALVDPTGVVFDSTTGALLDGATLTLIDVGSGAPAVVFGEDGSSAYPSSVVTGTSATDGSGRVYVFGPGEYRFPYIAPGTYRIDVTPPAGYAAPSGVSTTTLQALPGAPFTIAVGSRGESFTLASGTPTIEIDIPLDPAGEGLFAIKSASKRHAQTGEFVQYRVRIENGAAGPLAQGVEIIDELPYGFRYEEGSAVLDDGTAIDPSVGSQGRELRFAIGDLAPGDGVEVRYVAVIANASEPRDAVNTAVAVSTNGMTSNEATAVVRVMEDPLERHIIIAGRVTLDECGDAIDPRESGVPSVRLYLEDGTFVVTDERGLYHIEGVAPGVHLVQLDSETIPEGYEPMSCEGESDFARNPLSRYVDAQPGSLWRTNFHLRRIRGPVSQQLSVAREGERVLTELAIEIGAVAPSKLNAVFVLHEGFEVEPGSLALDGVVLDTQATDGTLTVRVPEIAPNESHQLRFVARAPAGAPRPSGVVMTRSMLIGQGPDGKAIRTPLAVAGVAFDETPTDVKQKTVPHAVELIAPTIEMAERLPPAPERKLYFEERFDKLWLAEQAPARAFVYPPEGHIPSIASVKLGIQHGPDDTVELYLNGKPVHKLNRDSTMFTQGRERAMSRWRGVDLIDDENIFEAVIFDASGEEVARFDRTVYYTGGPLTAEFVEEASSLVADGRTPPVIAVRLKDRYGRLVREGVTGQFRVNAPYQSMREVEEMRRTPLAKILDEAPVYTVGPDGIARIELHPTSVVGQVQIEMLLTLGVTKEIKGWMSPGQRDWVLVAIAEGTLGYNDSSGNEEALERADLDDEFHREGRIAFFAKGTVTGEWLLTVAYDSDDSEEEVGRRLQQVIDPDEYYSLYGDGTQQGYDAASSDHVYVKIERRNFYALYGDFETGLNDTELSAYNRTLTGMKTEYYGEHVRVNGFVSETDQYFVQDEIRGNGTSGLYQLSQSPIIVGSQRISIVTRDRFRNEVIVDRRLLTPFVDYNIDYLDGTLFFKQPILSRDENQNPVYIVAIYEAESDQFDDVNGGGRVAARALDGAVEVGASLIHQGAGEEEGNLVGIDARYEFAPGTELRAEVAGTRTDLLGDESDGLAYLVELEAQTENTRGLVYVREQGDDFGLGQQSITTEGTRRYGADILHEFNEDWLAHGEFFRHENLKNDNARNVAEIGGRYNHEPYTAGLGFRYINETGDDLSQLLYSASRDFYDGLFNLRAGGEVALHGGDQFGDYGDRLLLGGDLRLTEKATVYAENEWLWSDGRDAMDTRVGVRLAPWTGANVDTGFNREFTEYGPRSFANLGLTQTFSVGEHWSFSGSVDRSQTIDAPDAPPFDVNVPPTTGNRTGDFTATSLGAAYNEGSVNFTGRLENRVSDDDVRWGVYLSALQELGERTSYAGNFAFFHTSYDAGGEDIEGRLRLSLAHRPDDSDWMILNRLDLEILRNGAGSLDTQSWRIVDHFKANQFITRKLQIAWQLSGKYVVDTFQGTSYDSAALLAGVEARYFFHENWDFEVHARGRHMFMQEITGGSYGLSVGHAVIQNMWVSVGYNFTGFEDREFSRADYTAQGPFVKLRGNLDQNAVRKALDWVKSW